MSNIFLIITIISGISLVYVWILYPTILAFFSKLIRAEPRPEVRDVDLPPISIMIACLNEEESIKSRITNIYDSDYPCHLIQIIVISDGSTDKTAERARLLSSSSQEIVVLENDTKSGRAIAHNTGVKHASGEILVFTDAGTTFEPTFLHSIVQPFQRTNVGFVTGALRYTNISETEISQSAGMYWKFEQALRQYESNLGVNVFGSGACCAMRKELYRDIPPTGDVDFTSPLDASLQNTLCIHQPDAIAYDEMPDSRTNELNARVRMTSKNFKGTMERWGWTGVRKYPLKTLVILSHKYGRWITPFLLLTLLPSSIVSLVLTGGAFVSALVLGQIVFYALGLVGFLKLPVPGASTIYSFILGNYGMLLGVLGALSGRVVTTYTPIRNDPT